MADELQGHWDLLRRYARGPETPALAPETDTEAEAPRADAAEDAPGSGGNEPPRRPRDQRPPSDRGERSGGGFARVPNFARPWVSALASAPTPGGLLPLLGALLFLLFAIVPVGPRGSTRLELIWRALLGAIQIPPSDKALMDEQTAAALLGQAESAGSDFAFQLGESFATGSGPLPGDEIAAMLGGGYD